MHDICLSVMAGGMLIWAIQLWIGGSVTAGDVVLVSALTFRILHGSRDLALALVDATQQFGAIDDTLRIIVQPHGLEDTDTQLMLAEGASPSRSASVIPSAAWCSSSSICISRLGRR